VVSLLRKHPGKKVEDVCLGQLLLLVAINLQVYEMMAKIPVLAMMELPD
jgi:hypothetical protein